MARMLKKTKAHLLELILVKLKENQFPLILELKLVPKSLDLRDYQMATMLLKSKDHQSD